MKIFSDLKFLILWLLATPAGFLVAFFIILNSGFLADSSAFNLTSYIMLGAFWALGPAAAQLWALRSKVHISGWWFPATVLAFSGMVASIVDAKLDPVFLLPAVAGSIWQALLLRSFTRLYWGWALASLVFFGLITYALLMNFDQSLLYMGAGLLVYGLAMPALLAGQTKTNKPKKRS